MDMIEIAAMKKNPGRIESIAVTAVKEAILNAGNFDPVFNEKDTLPSWDGSIYVYKGSTQSKKELIEVIPVQIKGTTQDKRKCDKFNYSVEVSDLKNYLNCKSGSVLYFVVYIEERNAGIQKTIYYNKLLPYDLKRILSLCDNQNTIILEFGRFPENREDVACLLHDVARDIKKQRACIDAREITLEDLKSEQGIPLLTISRTVANAKKLQAPVSLLDYDGYFYAKRQDNLQQPVIHGRIGGIEVTMKRLISVDGVTYYDTCKRFEYTDRQVLKIGNAIEFVFPKNDKSKMSLNVNLSRKLSEDIREVSFLLALFEHKQLQLDDVIVPLDLQASSGCKFDVEMFRRHLDTCQMIQRLMMALDVTRDLDLAELRDEQHEGLSRLYGFIIEGNKARIEFRSDFCVINPEIGNLKILLFAISDKQNENCYEIRSFSDIRNILMTKDGHQTTPFVDLSVEQIMHVDNIKYENLFIQLETIPLSATHVKGVTHLFYKMLLAYDRRGDERPDILNSAIQLAEWLEAHDQYSDRVYKTLNKMEAIKRSRKLNEQDNEELFDIAENTELPPIYRSLAYVLLGEQKSAERFFKQVPENIQSAVREYPIFRFWQGNSTL